MPVSSIFRLLPMHRHYDLVRVEFEDQVRMSGGDQFMIDILLTGPDMTSQALLCPDGEIGQVHQSHLHRLFVLGIFQCMRTKPSRRGAMAVFARHAFRNIELASTFLSGNRKRMTHEAALRRSRRLQPHDFRHALRDRRLQS